MNRHPWWCDKVKRNLLSAGDWISNFAKGKEGSADYRFQAPVSGKYDFWARANPISAQSLDFMHQTTWNDRLSPAALLQIRCK